jgi:multiple sugar transport system ATP-binding protein
MNLVPAIAKKAPEAGWNISVTHGNEWIDIPYPHELPESYNERSVTLGLRPEHIIQEYPRDAIEGAYFTTSCVLDLTEPTGADKFGVFDLGGTEAMCRLKPDTQADNGNRVELHFEIGAACLFDANTGSRLDRR